MYEVVIDTGRHRTVVMQTTNETLARARWTSESLSSCPTRTVTLTYDGNLLEKAEIYDRT